jgi:hypothetical protein
MEFGAIFLAVALLNFAHRPDSILPVVAIIVGLHLFPLTSPFGATIYDATVILGTAIGVVGLFVPDSSLRGSAVGLSFAALLWLTCAAVLVRLFTAEQL